MYLLIPKTSVIQALSASGVEESSTLDNEPTQEKTCNSGRFLDSLSLPRNDMSGGVYRSSARVVIATLHGDESSPLHWVYRILGNTIQPHRFYSERGGRLIAAPTGVLPLRLLFLQCGAWYRASSTAYGGSPSPKGKVLAFYLCAGCSCNAERGTAPHPPPMAVPLPRRGRFWCRPSRRTGKPEP